MAILADSPYPPPRVVIDSLRPQVDHGEFPARRALGEVVAVQAVIFCDGHDELSGHLHYRHASEDAFHSVALVSQGNDSWQAQFLPDRLGLYYFTVNARIDRWLTWGHKLLKKWQAKQDLTHELEAGIDLLTTWLHALRKSPSSPSSFIKLIKEKQAYLNSHGHSLELADLKAFLADDGLLKVNELLGDKPSSVSFQGLARVLIEAPLAGFSSWYEFFPRSCTSAPLSHGTFASSQSRLAYAADLGFDVVYLPPIHPIGHSHRKGKNNALMATSTDVGSPWAIGSAEGGHKAIHPQLGTMADFEEFVAYAKNLRLEIALDIAFQCSPDHPYLREHPEWFSWRKDGSIQYAENPPKKYEDIVPFNFECEAWQSLWEELKSILLFWAGKGIRIFRVDNPHTKPLAFWQWLLAEVQKAYPDAIFLSEAFTRPHIMARLAKIGFSQSYTYFTWRDTKAELTTYLTELTTSELRDYFRPNFWPTTPDILTDFLRAGGRSAFMQKLILAATLSPNYGIYGPAFELLAKEKRDEVSEEHLNSEKYELHDWPLASADSLAPLMRRINRIRKHNSALRSNRTLSFHPINNDQLLAYSKVAEDGNMILIVVNLDPHHRQSGMVELPLERFNLSADASYEVHDLISDSHYIWHGSSNYVELNPKAMPAHIFAIHRKVRRERDFDYF